MRSFRLSLYVVALIVLVLPGQAFAQSSGIALRWNRCYGEDGAEFVRSFACDTNAGAEELVVSFALPRTLRHVSGVDAWIDIMSFAGVPGTPGGEPLPAWWHFLDAGNCRLDAISLSADPNPADVNCTGLWHGDSNANIAYAEYPAGTGTGVMLLSASLSLAVEHPAFEGVEYSAFRVRIDHSKTVGTDACAGCLVPMQAVLRLVTVSAPLDGGVVLTEPLDGAQSRYVLWGTGPVPTKRSSWSAVKSLYR